MENKCPCVNNAVEWAKCHWYLILPIGVGVLGFLKGCFVTVAISAVGACVVWQLDEIKRILRNHIWY